jgi:hypothetical protein
MEANRTKSLFPIVYSAAFLIAAGLSVLMLISDKNLQTNFGSLSSGYYSQWYLVLITAVADVVGAGLLLALRSRLAVKLGVVGSGALIAVLLGGILTYQQVGFATAGDFATYLFGITYYGGDIRYLFDALLATYIGTFLFGIVGLVRTRDVPVPASLSNHPTPGRREGEGLTGP